MDDKTKAVIAHITIVGWIIALVINIQEKEEMTSYYLRQLLGLYLTGLVFSFIPYIGWIISLIVFVFWILSLVGAIQGEKKESPVVGPYFQEWFSGL